MYAKLSDISFFGWSDKLLVVLCFHTKRLHASFLEDDLNDMSFFDRYDNLFIVPMSFFSKRRYLKVT